MSTKMATPVPSLDAQAPLRAGLGNWSGLVTADTPEGRARIAEQFSDWTAFAGSLTPPLSSLTTLSVDLTHGPQPRLRLVRDGQSIDFSPFLAGPGGKRFAAIAHPERRLFIDQVVGEDQPVLELRGGDLYILRRDLWPFYAMHTLIWRMLCEASVAALHAAVCAAEGVALVIVGPSGSGKSTLCWALAQQGADYFTDECAFFDLADHSLSVLPHRARLRPGGAALLDTPPESVVWREAKPGDPKFSPNIPAPHGPCPQKHLLLFADGFGEQPSLTPLLGGAAARRLTRTMGFGDPSPFARLEAAADLVSRTPCLSMTLGPPRETAKMLIAYARSL